MSEIDIIQLDDDGYNEIIVTPDGTFYVSGNKVVDSDGVNSEFNFVFRDEDLPRPATINDVAKIPDVVKKALAWNFKEGSTDPYYYHWND